MYKQGQAGITKASVTIVFNNENPQQSPVGYEQYDEITVTRQVCLQTYSRLMSALGCNWWKEQISHQWSQCASQSSSEPLPFRSAECE